MNANYQPASLLVGRVLMALLFVVFGYMKLKGFEGSTGYFAKWGFPMPQGAAALAVLFELGGGILLLIGWKTRWAAWALVLYVVVATAVAHRFWTYDAAQLFAQTSNFYKNLSIIGGLICLAVAGPGRFSIDKA